MSELASLTDPAWIFNGFDVRQWSARGLYHFDIHALFLDRGLVIEDYESEDEQAGVPIPGAFVKPPLPSNDSAAPHDGVAHEHICQSGEFDRFGEDGRPGYEGKPKQLPPRPAVLRCQCLSCRTISTAEMLVRYLRAGLITVDDLLNPSYGYTPLPSGFAIFPELGTDIYEVWHEDDPALTRELKHAKAGAAKDELKYGSVSGPQARNIDRIKKQIKETTKESIRRVCGYFRVDARTYDENDKAIGYRLTCYDSAGKMRHHDITEALVDGEGAALFQEMDRIGLNVSPEQKARASLRRLIKAWDTGERRIVLYSRPGWHHGNTLYLTPDGRALGEIRNGRATLQPDAMVERVEFADYDNSAYADAMDKWHTGVVLEIWKGDTDQFAFGMLTGCCGVVSSLLGMPAPVYFLHGPTTIGKTAAQIIGAGCVANPMPGRGVLVTADMSTNEAQRRASGTALHVDDKRTGKLDVEKFGYLAATQTQTPITLSSEQTLAEIVGPDMLDGLTVRVVSVDFRSIPRIDPARADAIILAAQTYYGFLLAPFVDEVMRQGWHRDTDALRARVDAYADAYVTGMPADRLAEWRRAAKAFAVLRVAGDVLLSLGILPDGATTADVDRVVAWAWNSYQGGRSKRDPVSDSMKALARWLHRHGDEVQPLEVAGSSNSALAWIADDGTAYIRADAIGRIPGVVLDRMALVKVLKDRGSLVTGAAGHRNLVWEYVPGHGRIKHYRVRTPTLHQGVY